MLFFIIYSLFISNTIYRIGIGCFVTLEKDRYKRDQQAENSGSYEDQRI